MKHQILHLTSIGLAVSTALFAQGAGGRGAGSVGIPTTPSGGINSPNTSRVPSTTPTQPNPNVDLQRPIYISGKVVLDDGTPPPDSVTLQLACSGSPRSVGFTDSKGRFSVDLGDRRNSAIFADASQPGYGGGGMGSGRSRTTQPMGATGTSSGGSGMTERNLMGCELRASLAGFRSDGVNLGNRRSLDNPDVGTIVLHRLGNVEGLTISATSALAPKDAKKAFDKGRNDEKKGKWDSAEKEFQKAVDVYPKYAAAWYELGLAQQNQNNLEGARKSYAQALAADPKLVTPYLQLSVLAANEKKWDEVASTTDRLVRLNPVDFPQAWFFNALARYELKQYDAAETAARKGLGADTDHRYPKLDQLLGVLLAQKHDYPGAAEHLNAYLRLAPEASDADSVKKQVADLQKSMTPETGKTP